LVRLVERRDNILKIQGVDVLDGTPLLDVKPYVPDFNIRTGVQIGWYPITARHRLYTNGAPRAAESDR
jgi:tRNA (Thr-GGU) A37 N-methylase